MRRIHWLFAIAAILAAMIPAREVLAQPPPLVECKDGKCSMTEEDWKQLREYHNRVREFIARVDKKNDQDNRAMPELMQKLSSCMAILEERRT